MAITILAFGADLWLAFPPPPPRDIAPRLLLEQGANVGFEKTAKCFRGRCACGGASVPGRVCGAGA